MAEFKPKYRPDIDGLRAIAVISVIAYHAFPLQVTGGFIGVDVFFVISGFLISTIIYRGLAKNEFSFSEFYARRIKRIFPALILVFLAIGSFGWFALLPEEYSQLGKHIAGGAGFLSNIVLWSEKGYFDNAAVSKPLLHLWSLGIEEQFYILWPLILWICWKRRINLFLSAITLAAVSFTWNVLIVNIDTAAAFYSPQTRAWELLIGASLVFGNLLVIGPSAQTRAPSVPSNPLCFLIGRGTARASLLSDALSVLGLSLLVVGIVIESPKVMFPGWWALLPTFGAAFLISAGDRALINRLLLSNKVLVWIGTISYPLYLWHWPLLSLLQNLGTENPSAGLRITAVVVATFLAWTTFRLIERPIRFGGKRHLTTLTLVILMSVLGVSGWYLHVHNGFPSRVGFKLGMSEEQIAAERKQYWETSVEGHFSSRSPKIIVYGDSQAFDIVKALINDSRIGVTIFRATYECSAFFSPNRGSEGKAAECQAAFNTLLQSRELPEADALIYAHFWVSGAEKTENYKIGVNELLMRNSRLRIFFFGHKPLLGKGFKSINAIIRNQHSLIGMNDFLRGVAYTPDEGNLYAKSMANSAGVTFVDVYSLFCSNNGPFYFNGKFSYFDEDHWTDAGAKVFYEKFSRTKIYQDIIYGQNGH